MTEQQQAETVDWAATEALATGQPQNGAQVAEPEPAVAQPTLGVKGSPERLVIEDDGVLMFKNRIVGEFDGVTLTVNAGWARLAGLNIKIDGDVTDRRRTVFERSVTDHRLASEA